MRRTTERLRAGLLACAPGLLLSACADRLTRSDDLWPYVGNAVAANRVAHVIDPWPPGSRDTAFPTVAARVADATIRYKMGRPPETVAPPVLVTR